MWTVLLGCPRAPLPPPVPDQTPDDPVTESFRLEPIPWTPATFVPTETVDVVVTGEGVRTARNDVHGQCDDSGRCVLEHVVPGERLALYADGLVDATVRAVPLPPATHLTPGVDTVVAWVSADGRTTSSSTFSLDHAAEVQVIATTRHPGAGHAGVHLPEFRLHGPTGPVQASVFSQFDDPTHEEQTFRLVPGDYAIRAAPEVVGERFVCRIPGVPQPAWCDQPPDAGPYELVLRIEVVAAVVEADAPLTPANGGERIGVGEVTRRIEPPPELPMYVVATTPGRDVVLTWFPATASVFYGWSASDGSGADGVCTENPCVFPAVAFSSIAISTPHVEEATEVVDIEVTQLAPPPPRDGLDPGFVMTVQVDEPPYGDPRPPFVDVVVRAPGPGTYRVGAKAPGDDPPSVELLPGSGWGVSALNLFGGEPNYRAEFFEVSLAGSAVVRITPPPGVTDELEIELQVED